MNICVDLDGTLVAHGPITDLTMVGPPIPAMVDKIKQAIEQGYEVRIFTARVSGPDDEAVVVKAAIQEWAFRNLGFYPKVTCCKDFDTVEIWDDRSVQVIRDTGEFVGESEVAD